MPGIFIAYYLFILAAVVFTFTLLARFVRAHEELAAQLARLARQMENRDERNRPS